MALSKPNEYKEVPAQQGEATVYAEDINQIISNIEKLKGGQANEAPISNIKELKEHLDNLEQGAGSGGNIDNIPADKVSFNNDNANLDFSSKYDFPKFKNELKEIYEIKLITDYSINNVSHIDEVQDVYTLILEKNTDKYILKGNLNYNNTSQYTSSLNFYIISIDGNNDFGHIISEMFQFINSESNAKENEILIEGLNNFKYAFGFYYAIPIFQIKKQDNSNFEEKEYTINIEIQLNNIKNNQEFIPIACGTSGLSFLKLKNINGKAAIIGETIQTSTDSSFILFSHFALENYFDIKTDQNDSYYIEANNNITSNKNKSLKYYIRKEITDGSELSPIYANIPITFYYLEIKHSDNSKIEYNEILTFNLTAPKNALKGTNVTTEETYSFEKTHITLNNGESELQINSDCFGDLSKVKLIKKSDGSLYLLGIIEFISSAEISVIRVSKTLNIDARKLVGLIMNQTTGNQYFSVYQDNYLYICFVSGENQEANINISSDKIYDPNIICPTDINFALLAGYNISEDFGIHLIDGKYILKGSITPTGNTAAFCVNCSIEDFFENGKSYEYAGYTIQAVSQRPLYGGIIINGLTANKENIIYMECPKQPAI